NHAEEISIRILQHHKVAAGSISPRVTRRTKRDQSLHFNVPSIRVKVKVHPTSRLTTYVSRLKRQIWTLSLGIAKDHPAIGGRLPGNVAQGFLPEGHRAIEFMTMYDD